MSRILFAGASLVVATLLAGGCHRSSADAKHATNTDLQITAKLVSPRDIIVDWKDPRPGAAGHIVEWGTKPDDEFVPLGFFRPEQSTYKHPDLMWDTTCYYRIRPYYGPASAEVEVKLPADLTDAEYKRRFDAPEDYTWAGPVVVPDTVPAAKRSLRDSKTAAEAAPTNFKITLMPVTVSAFKLTWTDHASDEDGTMIELKKEGSDHFEVVALVDPNVNSFGWAFEPPMRKGVLRVRPFYYGSPSKLVHLTTGKEPAEAAKAAAAPAAPAGAAAPAKSSS